MSELPHRAQYLNPCADKNGVVPAPVEKTPEEPLTPDSLVEKLSRGLCARRALAFEGDRADRVRDLVTGVVLDMVKLTGHENPIRLAGVAGRLDHIGEKPTGDLLAAMAKLAMHDRLMRGAEATKAEPGDAPARG